MPYLPAKDELVSLNRLSSRGLWKWYNSKVLDGRLYGVGQHFTFCRFSRKRKFFGNFDCDFRKCFTKGFFLTEYEEFRNFRFDGKFSIFTDSRDPWFEFSEVQAIILTLNKRTDRFTTQYACTYLRGLFVYCIWDYRVYHFLVAS